MGKPDADDDDPFSLDFTKICVDEVPEPAAAPVIEPAPAPAPVLELISSAPAVQVEAEPAPSAFESFKAPLELVDFSAVAEDAALEPPAPAPAAKPEEAKAEPVNPAAKKPPSQVSVLVDIARQHAAGKTAEASSALEAALRAGTLGKATEQGWGMLFDLLQILNRRQAFENLADAYAKRFEKSAPAWLDASGEADGSLETGGGAYVALSGILSASSEGALKKLVEIAGSNPTVPARLAQGHRCRQRWLPPAARVSARNQEAGP